MSDAIEPAPGGAQESEGQKGAPEPEVSAIDPERAEWATKELAEIGLESVPENVETVLLLQETLQIPDGHEAIAKAMQAIDYLNPDPEKQTVLLQAMQEQGVKSIVHAEGPRVWDHVKFIMRTIDQLGVDDQQKQDMKAIMLYHDLGKAFVSQNEQNSQETQKRLGKGTLHVSMIGHAKRSAETETAWAKMEAGLRANGVTGEKHRMHMEIIAHHHDELGGMSESKLFETVNSYGADDEKRRAFLNLLIPILHVDGESTVKVDATKPENPFGRNEKKTMLDAEQIFAKFVAARTTIEAKLASEAAKKLAEAREAVIFGMSIGEYVKGRGKQGKEIREAIEKVQSLIASSADKSPEEMKQMVDELPL